MSFGNVDCEFNNSEIRKIFRRNEVFADAVREAKSYILNYFRKSLEPSCYIVWNNKTRKLILKDESKIRHIITNHRFQSEGNSFCPRKWFIEQYDELVSLTCSLTRDREFKRGNDTFINTFSGFMYDDVQEEYDTVDSEKIKLILDHIKQVWASDNTEVYEYMLNWLSTIAQRGKNESILYLNTKEGTGKSALTEFLKQYVFGQGPSLMVESINQIIGDFNASLEGITFVVIEEAESCRTADRYKLAQKLKYFATQKTLNIRPLHKEYYESENLMNIVLLSNGAIIKLSQNDRRMLCVDMSEKRMGDREYFNNLFDSFNEESGLAFWKFLVSRDITKYRSRNIPKTETRAEYRIEMANPLFKYLRDQVNLGQGLKMSFHELETELRRYMKEHNFTNPPSKIKISKYLKDIDITTTNYYYNKRSVKGFKLSYTELYNKLKTAKLVNEQIDDIPMADPDCTLASEDEKSLNNEYEELLDV